MFSPHFSLLCRPSPSPPLLHHRHHKPSLCHGFSSSLSLSKPHRRRHLHLRLRAFSSQNPNPSPDLAKDPIFDPNPQQSPDLSQQTPSEVAEQPAVVDGTVVETVESGTERKSRLPIVVFLVGVLASVRRGFDRLATSEWLSWWPFWQQEKRLERLIAEADANPKDAVKEGALLAELNKHRCKMLARRFLRRTCLILGSPPITCS
ncbi:putative ATP-dependent zinc metalloprotease FTSH 9, chloroplastic/mitochondrial [Iris pallida]|uniref:ATP-dependent zinc metalloprotease FTSH 9, chloroplastic/mitochondrial n=1 Tax=Iris pallida TaxID=29817 RepID=A0AAX6HDN5_IRIPA|nr:putative ATP-dependent zinc metalloprotease FTSH 9, chloroplastic/mitochondrial [Iris pallida]KAJ6839139.1 putative ATP-dependent zinc metalloprotease FTSH 9, chloroplastic/mitochondrial [Iris pallida]